MNIVIRELKYVDLVPDLLEHFNRYQKISNVWRMIDGKKLLIENPFIENWDNELKREIVYEDFTDCINSGGIVFGVFYNGNTLIAFSSLLHNFFGSQKQYVQLMQLHISTEYRRLGFGKELFALCVKKAKEWGAKKLYISGHSAEETQQFYEAVGCVDAKEINDDIASHEPFDVQLEYKL
ncbi:GNAT family N-acetyltransferase [Clostridium sp. FP2]|uniref:GNAT family N-acetyltransferase n=1 Tax=Clostridium sp. FP2 TaxID=2724481 RepID=UPI0013E8FDB8|nr:GNAT family N-acetyltransferase [Clostridium sp. FP2]MBZ9626167.1 GNAT family N-acetyltransferase [Clostridium sp. FP2]